MGYTADFVTDGQGFNSILGKALDAPPLICWDYYNNKSDKKKNLFLFNSKLYKTLNSSPHMNKFHYFNADMLEY